MRPVSIRSPAPAGEAGRLVKTDFRSVTYETVPVGEEACFLDAQHSSPSTR